jgi:hypothetical protein
MVGIWLFQRNAIEMSKNKGGIQAFEYRLVKTVCFVPYL